MALAHVHAMIRQGRPTRALVLLCLIAILLGVAGQETVRAALFPEAWTAAPGGWAAVAAGAGVYLLSHLLRASRLALIAGSHRVSIRALFLVHFQSAALSIAVPFKLGDAARVLLVAGPAGGLVQGVLVVWAERLFDAVIIAVLLALVLIGRDAASAELELLLVLYGIFVAATLFAFVIVPENVRALSLFVLRRYDGRGAVRVMGACRWVSGVLSIAHALLRRRIMTLAVLSAAIWALEVLSVMLVAAGALAGLGPAVAALLSYLSVAPQVGEPGMAALPLLFAAVAASRAPVLLIGLGGCVVTLFSRQERQA